MRRDLCSNPEWLERDLLRKKLNAYQRQLFAAKSEVRGAEQRDLFLNEAAGTSNRMRAGAGERNATEQSETRVRSLVDIAAVRSLFNVT